VISSASTAVGWGTPGLRATDWSRAMWRDSAHASASPRWSAFIKCDCAMVSGVTCELIPAGIFALGCVVNASPLRAALIRRRNVWVLLEWISRTHVSIGRRRGVAIAAGRAECAWLDRCTPRVWRSKPFQSSLWWEECQSCGR